MTESQNKLLIIGYGNTLRFDDGLGVVVAEHLQQLLTKHRAFISFKITHQLYPEMMDDIRQVQHVIFVDASVEGIHGEIHHEHIPSQQLESFAHIHSFTPQQLIHQANKLYQTQIEADLFSITGESFELGEELSEIVRNAIPQLLKRICEKIDEFFKSNK